MIIALDLGTTTGWAIKQDNGQIVSGSTNFQPRRFEGGGMRYLRFNNWLSEVKQSGKIEAVYYEEVRRHVGTDAAHIYGGFLANLTAFCEQHQIPYSGVPVGSIKKYITGKGNASKGEMIATMKKKGHVPVDDNEADALALLYLAIETK